MCQKIAYPHGSVRVLFRSTKGISVPPFLCILRQYSFRTSLMSQDNKFLACVTRYVEHGLEGARRGWLSCTRRIPLQARLSLSEVQKRSRFTFTNQETQLLTSRLISLLPVVTSLNVTYSKKCIYYNNRQYSALTYESSTLR